MKAQQDINTNASVYVSYAWANNEHPDIEKEVYSLLNLLDKNGIYYKSGKDLSFIDNAENEITQSKAIIVAISKRYIESLHCMHEWHIIRHNSNIKDIVFPILLEDASNITDENVFLQYRHFFEGRKINLTHQQAENIIPLTSAEEEAADAGFYIDDLTFMYEYIKDHNCKGVKYTTIIEQLKTKLNHISDNTRVCDKETVVVPSFSLSIPDGLIHREAEEEKLFNFVAENRIVNLVGVGGSGKSSLAHLMMKKYSSAFNEIAYTVVNNNVKNDMVDQLNKTLKLEFEGDAYTEIVSYLQDNYKSEKPNLLVLDINETADKDKTAEYINEILKDTAYLAGWKILILSRESVDTRNRIKTYNLNDNEDFDFLKKLFLYKAGARYNDFGDFAGLFKVIYYNPLLAEQLGWYLNDYPKTATLDDIKKILYGSFGEQEMQGMSAAQRHYENVNSFLKNLIVYDKFEENEQKLLRHFILWQSEYIGYDVIADLLKDVFESDDELIKTLMSLSKSFILTTNNEETLSYKLHGLLADSLREQIKIENEDYHKYLWNIDRIIEYGYYRFIPYVDCITNSLCEYDIAANNSYLGYSLVNKVGRKLANSWKRDHAIRLLSKNIRDIEEHIKKDKDNNSLYEQLILAHSCIPSEQSKLSKTNLEKAIEILEKMPKDIEKYQHALALVYSQYASEQSKFEDVVSIFDKIFEIRHNLPKTNEYQNALADAYKALAVFSAEKFYKYIFAKENFEKSIAISEQLPKDNPKYQDGLAEMYRNLADLQCDHLGEYELSKANYEKSIAIREQLPKDNPEYQNGLANTYNYLAILQQNHLGDYELSKSNYEKAIAIQEQLPKDNPEYQNGLASAYHNLANLQQDHLGEYELSKSNYEKSIAIREQLPKDNPEYQNGLAEVYINLGNLQQYHLGEYELSKSNYEKAIAICEQLPKKNPKYQNNLASVYNNLANLQENRLGDYDSAKANYEKAIAIRKQLPKDNPEYQNGLASSYNGLAYCYKAQKQYTEAITAVNNAIAITKQLSDNNAKYLPDWINRNHSLAEIYFDNNGITKAKDILAAIQPMAKKCLDEKPDDNWTQELNDAIADLLSKIGN